MAGLSLATEEKPLPVPEPESHPPVGRLLGFYHRTIHPTERRGIGDHLAHCLVCRGRMRRIEATVTLFRNAPAWRQDCPSISQLFHQAGSELEGDEARSIQTHLPLCSACREELLIFREVRQAARIGHSAFLNPLNWKLRTTYWRRRGYWRWLFQPRWRRPARRLAWATLAGLAAFLIYEGVEVELERQSGERKADIFATVRPPDRAEPERQTKAETLPTPARPSATFCFRYEETGGPRRLPEAHPDARWASHLLETAADDPHTFRLGEPPGLEGIVVLRPGTPLTAATLRLVEASMQEALSDPARFDRHRWSATRARLMQLIRGEVWLLPLPASDEVQSGRWAGPEQAGAAGAPGWTSGRRKAGQGSGVKTK